MSTPSWFGRYLDGSVVYGYISAGGEFVGVYLQIALELGDGIAFEGEVLQEGRFGQGDEQDVVKVEALEFEIVMLKKEDA